MAETLILDAEAVHALARPKERLVLAQRARAILTVAHEHRALVRVPAAVLAEVCRSTRLDAAVHHLLNGRGIVVVDVSRRIAERAGHLLAKHKLSSAHAIDALVVATAVEAGEAVVATGDPSDIRRLATGHRQVRVLAL